MNYKIFLGCLKCHKDHCIEISAQSEHLYKFDLWPLCDPLMTSNEFQNPFKMPRMSQGSLFINLSSIGAFLKIWPLTPLWPLNDLEWVLKYF